MCDDGYVVRQALLVPSFPLSCRSSSVGVGVAASCRGQNCAASEAGRQKFCGRKNCHNASVKDGGEVYHATKFLLWYLGQFLCRLVGCVRHEGKGLDVPREKA